MNFAQKNKKFFFIGIAMLVFAVGIFLRTYHFHDWLNFSADQVRDANLVRGVVTGNDAWPLLGPTMRKSAESKTALFHLGPIYYYFQIISAKIFGDFPDKLAYPDLLFGVFSIPLFYFFVRKYFQEYTAFALASIYAISFYVVVYSRFAWNPNSIPFFVLLFLWSLYEFLMQKQKIAWIWVVAIGIAIGIGIQLHMILLLLFPLVAGSVFIYLLRKDRIIWRKIMVVFVIAIVLNFGQIISEGKTGLANSKIFLNSITTNSQGSRVSFLRKIADNVDCHIEANIYILSSLGQSDCNFSYLKILTGHSNSIKKESMAYFWTLSLAGLAFSIFGYIFLIVSLRKERDEKRRNFLRLILLYAGMAFLVMLPVIGANLTEFRYFIAIFFMPFIFLGFLLEFLTKRNTKYLWLLAVSIFLLVLVANLKSIGAAASDFLAQQANDGHVVVLGETEIILDFLARNSNGQDVYLIGDKLFVSNLAKPLLFLGQAKNLNIIDAESSKKDISTKKNLFYIEAYVDNETTKIRGYDVSQQQSFGKIKIYKLKN